jgi:pimeloyl-ACP methyl ester carboxylesterase
MPEAVVNGVRLVYQVQGVGTPALLICGTGQAASMWLTGDTLPAITGAGCSVTTFDNRGIPPSDCPQPPWTVADMAADAAALIEHLEMGPCHVLGGSLGALITQTVALTRPDLVRSATLLVGGGNFCRSAEISMRGQVELLRKGVEFPQATQLANTLEAVLTDAQRQDDAIVESALTLAGQFTSTFGPGGQYGQLHADAAWAAEDHLSELAGMSVPCLVIAAEHDPYFPPAHLKAAAERIPDARYVELPGSPHVTTDPVGIKLSNAAISEFLKAH